MDGQDYFFGSLDNPINRARPGYSGGTGGTQQGQFPQPGRQKRQMPSCSEKVCQQIGRVIDPETLDNITRDVQEGIVGADGWRAEFGLIVTWERMAYGGAPKMVDVRDFEKYKQWVSEGNIQMYWDTQLPQTHSDFSFQQNTYQLIIATDEIRSYVIFNYARLNWTTSNEAGGLNGFGGKQAAMVKSLTSHMHIRFRIHAFISFRSASMAVTVPDSLGCPTQVKVVFGSCLTSPMFSLPVVGFTESTKKSSPEVAATRAQVGLCLSLSIFNIPGHLAI